MKKCKVKNCSRKYGAKGYCITHYYYWKRHDIPFSKKSIEWVAKRGKGTITPEGYRILTKNGKRIREHRWIMEQKIGRTLLPNEHVHHINGNRLDNRIENLKIVDNFTHKFEHTRKYENGIKSCSRCGKIKNIKEFAFRLNSRKSKFRRRFYDSWCHSCKREVDNNNYKKQKRTVI